MAIAYNSSEIPFVIRPLIVKNPSSGNADSSVTSERVEEIYSELALLKKSVSKLANSQPGLRYTTTFTQSSLNINNILPVVHSLGVRPSGLSIWDSSAEEVEPDNVIYINENAIAIDFSSYVPLIGTYTVVVSE